MLEVERLGGWGYRVHEQCANADLAGDGQTALNRILEHSFANLPGLPTAVDRQPAENHDRNGLGHVPADGPWAVLARDGPGREAVVADD